MPPRRARRREANACRVQEGARHAAPRLGEPGQPRAPERRRELRAFAAVVLVAQALGISTSATQASAAVYFYARVAHALIPISGFGRFRARTMLFSVAWIAFIVFAVVVLERAL